MIAPRLYVLSLAMLVACKVATPPRPPVAVPPAPRRTASLPAPTPPAPPLRVELATGPTGCALAAGGEHLAVTRGGWGELWRLADGEPLLHVVASGPRPRFSADGRVVDFGRGGLDVASGAPRDMPPEPPLRAERRQPSGLALRGLTPAARARLGTWVGELGGQVEGDDPALVVDGPDASFDASGDGRLIAASYGFDNQDWPAHFLRLDTGARWSVEPWLHGMGHYSATPLGWVRPILGPTAERVLLQGCYAVDRAVECEGRLASGEDGTTIVAAMLPGLVAWSASAQLFAAGDGSNVAIHHAATGDTLATVPGGGLWDQALALDESSQRVLTALCGVHDILGTGTVFQPALAQTRSHDVAFADDGRLLLDLREDGLAGWDVERGEHLRLLDEAIPEATLVLDAGARHVAVASATAVHVLDLASRTEVASFAVAQRPAPLGVHGTPRPAPMSFLPDGQALALAHDDRVDLSPLDAGATRTLRLGKPADALAVAISDDGAWLAVLRSGKDVHIALVSLGGKARRTVALGRPCCVPSPPAGLAFRPGTHELAASSWLGEQGPRLMLIDADSGRRLATSAEGYVGAELAWTADGTELVTDRLTRATFDAKLQPARAATRTMRSPRDVATRGTAPDEPPEWLALRPDGQLAAALASNGSLRLVRLRDGATLQLVGWIAGGEPQSLVLDDHGRWDGTRGAVTLLRARGPYSELLAVTPEQAAALATPALLRDFLRGPPGVWAPD